MLYRKDCHLAPIVGFYKLSNSTLTLHAHFTCSGSAHYRYYREMCEKHNIPVVTKCPDLKEGDNGSAQSDISSFVVWSAIMPPWDCEGLILHLCKWIVLDNQVRITVYYIPHAYICSQLFSVVEKELFKALLAYQWPSMTPHDFPSQTTITDKIYTKSLCIKGLLAEKFKLLNSRVSFTFDTGTS